MFIEDIESRPQTKLPYDQYYTQMDIDDIIRRCGESLLAKIKAYTG